MDTRGYLFNWHKDEEEEEKKTETPAQEESNSYKHSFFLHRFGTHQKRSSRPAPGETITRQVHDCLKNSEAELLMTIIIMMIWRILWLIIIILSSPPRGLIHKEWRDNKKELYTPRTVCKYK